jgi:hypothetical protein
MKEAHKLKLLSEILATELRHLIHITATVMTQIRDRPKKVVQEKGGFYSQRRAQIKTDKCRKGVTISEVTKQVKKNTYRKFLTNI